MTHPAWSPSCGAPGCEALFDRSKGVETLKGDVEKERERYRVTGVGEGWPGLLDGPRRLEGNKRADGSRLTPPPPVGAGSIS